MSGTGNHRSQEEPARAPVTGQAALAEPWPSLRMKPHFQVMGALREASSSGGVRRTASPLCDNPCRVTVQSVSTRASLQPPIQILNRTESVALHGGGPHRCPHNLPRLRECWAPGSPKTPHCGNGFLGRKETITRNQLRFIGSKASRHKGRGHRGRNRHILHLHRPRTL